MSGGRFLARHCFSPVHGIASILFGGNFDLIFISMCAILLHAYFDVWLDVMVQILTKCQPNQYKVPSQLCLWYFQHTIFLCIMYDIPWTSLVLWQAASRSIVSRVLFPPWGTSPKLWLYNTIQQNSPREKVWKNTSLSAGYQTRFRVFFLRKILPSHLSLT